MRDQSQYLSLLYLYSLEAIFGNVDRVTCGCMTLYVDLVDNL